MANIEVGDKTIELDERGFMVDPGDWDREVACAMAEGEGVEELTAEMIEIIEFMRQYYFKFNAFPIVRSVCKRINKPRDCVEEAFIDPLKAWKIAGLPNPGVIATETAGGEHSVYRFLTPG